MTVGLNASQARAKSSQDMIIFNETEVIMRAVIVASSTGQYETFVSDDTVMTLSTPMASKIGTSQNPVIAVGDTLIINGHTITLGTTATTINGIVCDINDAEIEGVTARKDSGFVVLDIELTASQTWTYSIGAGTANSKLGFIEGVYTIPDTPSVEYFNTWQGTSDNRAFVQQMDGIIKYFANLGYKIERLTNSNTSKTFKWHIYW